MFFNLVVRKLKHLQSIDKSCLGSFCLCKVVCDFLVREGLLNVLIVEVNDGVAVGETFTFHTIIENNLLLSRSIDTLDLAIVANDLLNNLAISWSFTMVFFWVFKTVILVLLCSSFLESFSHLLLDSLLDFFEFLFLVVIPIFTGVFSVVFWDLTLVLRILFYHWI